MYLIEGVVKHYDWGGPDFIPALRSIPNPDGKPFAEYWLGVHPGGPSKVFMSHQASTDLPSLIRSHPERYLGASIQQEFGELPFLLKVLDVRDMLSIQVHPNKAQAEAGFAAENALGVPLDAAHRNYKDRNHKPEVMFALSEFWLLHGFKPNLADSLETNEHLAHLLPLLENKGLPGLYQYVMELPQEGIDKMFRPLADQILPLYASNTLDKSSPDFWAARALLRSSNLLQSIDRGIFSIYCFNIVRMMPGEAIFQEAGVPHAYLEGQNIELMSNSDNVLRAGLTTKHIDVPELLKLTRFEYIIPELIRAEVTEHETRYPCPVRDFELYHVKWTKGMDFHGHVQGPEIWLLISGSVKLSGNREVVASKGEAVFMVPGESYRGTCLEDAILFRAAVS